MKKLQWWTMAVLMFVLMGTLLVDIFLFMNDSESTVSAAIIEFTGASTGSYRSAMIGFIVGSLLTHFTKWGKSN